MRGKNLAKCVMQGIDKSSKIRFTRVAGANENCEGAQLDVGLCDGAEVGDAQPQRAVVLRGFRFCRHV